MAKGAAKRIHGKNQWALCLLILSGIVLGGVIGNIVAGLPILSWLSWGQAFGLTSPVVLDIGIMVITFGLSFKITIASIIGVILAIVVYRFL